MEFLYDWFVQLGKNWNLFISTQPEELQEGAQAFKNLFINEAYTYAFMVLIICPLLMVALYYWWYSKYPGFKYRLTVWIMWLFLSLIFVFGSTYGVIISTLHNSYIFSTFYLPKLALINVFYAVIVFVLGSLLITKIFPNSTQGYKLI